MNCCGSVLLCNYSTDDVSITGEGTAVCAVVFSMLGPSTSAASGAEDEARGTKNAVSGAQSASGAQNTASGAHNCVLILC